MACRLKHSSKVPRCQSCGHPLLPADTSFWGNCHNCGIVILKEDRV